MNKLLRQSGNPFLSPSITPKFSFSVLAMSEAFLERVSPDLKVLPHLVLFFAMRILNPLTPEDLRAALMKLTQEGTVSPTTHATHTIEWTIERTY